MKGDHCFTALFMGKTFSIFKCYLRLKGCVIYGQKLVYINVTDIEVIILVEKLTIHFYRLKLAGQLKYIGCKY